MTTTQENTVQYSGVKSWKQQ